MAWVEWLLGQAPRQSDEIYVTYVWDNLPSPDDIASGKVGRVLGEAPLGLPLDRPELSQRGPGAGRAGPLRTG